MTDNSGSDQSGSEFGSAVGTDDSTGRKIRLGHITGVFGIKGWVKVHSDTHPRENIVRYPRWYLGREQQRDDQVVELESGRPQGKTIVAKLKGVDSPEQALVLTGRVISVDRQDLPALEKGAYYWADLIGFDVRDEQGVLLGTVERLFETGANDVLVVRRLNSAAGGGANMGHEQDRDKRKQKVETEILIPWVTDTVIREVNLADGLIRVDWDPDY